MNKTNFTLILLLSLTVLASGCLDGQQEVTGVVETLPEVQEFLDDNPDASIDAVRWNSDYIEDNFNDISETCQPAIDTEKDHYRVNIEDNNENIVTWLEADEMEVMCVTREGDTSEDTEEETIEPENETLTESDIEGDITEVTIEENSTDPTRPEINEEDGIEFVNNAEFDIQLEFDREGYEAVTIEEGESKIKDFQDITYYEISAVEDDIEFRTPGGTGINVQESDDSNDVPTEEISMNNIDLEDRPVRGSEDAPVTLVKYEDFFCPFCGAFNNEDVAEEMGANSAMPQIMEEYVEQGDVKVYYKHLPVVGGEQPALASECVAQQDHDAFWEFHDQHIDRHTKLTDLAEESSDAYEEELYSIVEDTGVAVNDFEDCFENEEETRTIEEDSEEANSLEINATPSVVIEDELITGAQPFEVYETVIQEEL